MIAFVAIVAAAALLLGFWALGLRGALARERDRFAGLQAQFAEAARARDEAPRTAAALEAARDELVRASQRHAGELQRAREDRVAAEAALRAEHARQLRDLQADLGQLRDKLVAAESERAGISAVLAAEKAHTEEKIRLLCEAEERLRENFARASREALDANQAQLVRTAEQLFKQAQETAQAEAEKRQSAVSQLVQPMRESLEGVDRKIQLLEKANDGAAGRLGEQLRAVAESNDRLRLETSKLATALRAPAQRGRWGETQLRRTLELAGLRAHVDFSEQPVVQGAEGMLRPDVAVHLPGGKTVLLDSKVPLDAYLRAAEASEAERPALLRSHAEQLRVHIESLARKQYWEAFAGSPEMAVLFLPNDELLAAALDVDPTLHQDAFRSRIILATPSTLLGLLLTIAYVWKQESIAQNAREIANNGRDLHKRIGDLVGHLVKLGRALDSATETYNKAVGSFEHRVLPATRRFQELGAASADVELKPLPALEVKARLPGLEEAPALLPDDVN